MVGETWRQESEAAGHTGPTVDNMNAGCHGDYKSQSS